MFIIVKLRNAGSAYEDCTVWEQDGRVHLRDMVNQVDGKRKAASNGVVNLGADQDCRGRTVATGEQDLATWEQYGHLQQAGLRHVASRAERSGRGIVQLRSVDCVAAGVGSPSHQNFAI